MLINKENLLRQLDDRPPDGWISVQAVRSMIEGEPEHKGRWINIGHVPGLFKHPYSEDYQCSECGYTVYGWGWQPTKFCVNCGARMVKE